MRRFYFSLEAAPLSFSPSPLSAIFLCSILPSALIPSSAITVPTVSSTSPIRCWQWLNTISHYHLRSFGLFRADVARCKQGLGLCGLCAKLDRSGIVHSKTVEKRPATAFSANDDMVRSLETAFR